MKWLVIGFSLAVVFVAVPALAEKPETGGIDLKSTISPGELTPTPEMWFYEEDFRRYTDPKLAVRKKAEFRTATRQQRMAALKWFGMSNQRPKAGVDPQQIQPGGSTNSRPSTSAVSRTVWSYSAALEWSEQPG